jgi:hypothetical protein
MTMTEPFAAGGEIAADPVELTRLATVYLDQSDLVATALRATELAVPPPADFGRTPGAALLGQASDASTEQAGLAVGRLVEVLEGDVDRLYRIAFAYHEANRQATLPAPQPTGPLP